MNLALILHKTLGTKQKAGRHREHISKLTSFVALYPLTCCLVLVSKKDNFLADGIDVMQTDLSGD